MFLLRLFHNVFVCLILFLLVFGMCLVWFFCSFTLFGIVLGFLLDCCWIVFGLFLDRFWIGLNVLGVFVFLVGCFSLFSRCVRLLQVVQVVFVVPVVLGCSVLFIKLVFSFFHKIRSCSLTFSQDVFNLI